MKLDEEKKIPFEVHYHDHMWLRDQKMSQERRRVWLSKLYGDVAKTVILAMLGAVGWLIVFGGEVKFKEVIKEVQVVEQGVQK